MASIRPAPEFDFVELAQIVDHIVATARNARQLIRLHSRKRIWISIVDSTLLKRTRSEMAVKTLAVVVWLM